MKWTPTQNKTAVVLVFSRVAQLFGAYSPRGWGCPNPVRETRPFLRCHSILKLIFLPRQARDKHRENTPKSGACFLPDRASQAGRATTARRISATSTATGRNTTQRDTRCRIIHTSTFTVRNTNAYLLRYFMRKMIILPRQARDKHREDSKKRCDFRQVAARLR
jgi:hypothetical protein